MSDGAFLPNPIPSEAAIRLPNLTASSLKQVFEALRQGEDVQAHPFLELLWLRQYTAFDITSTGPVPSIILFDALSGVVTMCLEKLRSIYELPSLSVNLTAREAMMDLARVAQTGNRLLMGGSAVFYRYIRYDLDWQMEQISQYLGQSGRTTRRFMNDFWGMLVKILIQLEANALGIVLNFPLHHI
ncbi:MAG: hypothetical protein DPW16_22155 [Chloroflexi bacterium]|nr:hypothetical protein [Chloroflexota bacterium]